MSAPGSNGEVLAVEGAEVRVGGRGILGPVDLHVGQGERWVLLGPNGSGKTTLLEIAGARRHPSAGRVRILGARLGAADFRRVHPRIGHLGHRLTEMLPPGIGVLDVVLSGKRSTLVTWLQRLDDRDLRRARERLRDVGCEHLASQPLAACSQGERQRVLLARALFGRPDLLILDEPAAGLDLPARELLIRAVETATGAPSLLLATHHLEEIPPSVTHAALLRQGVLLASGSIETLLTPEWLRECFGMPVELGRRNGRWWATAAS